MFDRVFIKNGPDWRSGLLVFLLFCVSLVQAEEKVWQVQQLKFGEIVVVDNNAQNTLVFDPNLGLNTNDAIVVINEGQHGVIQFEGFPANFSINASIAVASDETSFEAGSVSPQFALEPVLEFENFTTDVNGDFELRVFGRLTTSGTGQRYRDGIYFRNYTILVNY